MTLLHNSLCISKDTYIWSLYLFTMFHSWYTNKCNNWAQLEEK